MERKVIAATAAANDSIVDLIGNTPLRPPPPLRARGAAGVELYAKAEWHNPGGSVKDRAAAAHDPRGRAHRARCTHGKIDPRRDVRQHRHRLRDDRRGARLPRQAVRAGERHARAQAHPARVRRRHRLHRPAGGVRRRDPRGAGASTRPTRIATSTRTSTTTRPTGARTTTRPAPEILEQTGGRVTHFVAGLGTSGTFMGAGRCFRERERRRSSSSRCSRIRRCTASKA